MVKNNFQGGVCLDLSKMGKYNSFMDRVGENGSGNQVSDSEIWGKESARTHSWNWVPLSECVGTLFQCKLHGINEGDPNRTPRNGGYGVSTNQLLLAG